MSVESTSDNYQHLNTVSISEPTTENKKVSRSGIVTKIFPDENYDENSTTEDYYFPDIDAA